MGLTEVEFSIKQTGPGWNILDDDGRTVVTTWRPALMLRDARQRVPVFQAEDGRVGSRVLGWRMTTFIKWPEDLWHAHWESTEPSPVPARLIHQLGLVDRSGGATQIDLETPDPKPQADSE